MNQDTQKEEGFRYEKVDFDKEQPSESGKYFTWNEYQSVLGHFVLEMGTTVFTVEDGRVTHAYNVNPVRYWLKPIE